MKFSVIQLQLACFQISFGLTVKFVTSGTLFREIHSQEGGVSLLWRCWRLEKDSTSLRAYSPFFVINGPVTQQGKFFRNIEQRNQNRLPVQGFEVLRAGLVYTTNTTMTLSLSIAISELSVRSRRVCIVGCSAISELYFRLRRV